MKRVGENPRKSARLGFVTGWLLAIISIRGRKSRKPAIEDLQHGEFKRSTQKLGMRFTDKIRDIFRVRWLKKK